MTKFLTFGVIEVIDMSDIAIISNAIRV